MATWEARIEAIYVSPRSAAPVESRRTARLLPGLGIEGDRYAAGTGTYSASFMSEPGRSLTMVSSEGIAEAAERTGMAPFRGDDIGELRRNIVLSGISASALNATIGHEVRIGANCRVFVHRRCVPCKYREAACQRPGLMNNLWGVAGVNCEVLTPLDAGAGDEVRVGDAVAVIPGTNRPDRIDVGRKSPGWAIRPADRTAEDVRAMVKPPLIAAIACLIDPEGFQRLEDAYNSVGQRFWSPMAYSVGRTFKWMRTILPVAVLVAVLSIGVAAYSQ